MSGFGEQLREFGRGTGIRFDQVVRKITIDLNTDLVRLTPVDTGMARSNWFFGLTPVADIDHSPSKNGSPSTERAMDWAAELKAGGIFYITNNVPYIMVLEYGSSKQAPNGMARITVDAWQQRVDKIVSTL